MSTLWFERGNLGKSEETAKSADRGRRRRAARCLAGWSVGLCMAAAGCGGAGSDGTATAIGRTEAALDSDYTKTRYPIVLCHGMFGFVHLAGVFDYWYGVPEALRAGGAEVYLTQVAPLASSRDRGEALIAQIERIVAISGKPKVNLIGHSQGGIDIRYVAAVRPDLVASVTTVGGPHFGADLASRLVASSFQGGFSGAVVDILGNFLGTIIGWLSGNGAHADLVQSLRSLSAEGAAEFNATFNAALPTEPCGSGPEVVDGVHYFSWGGTSVLTNILDPTDPVLSAASLVASTTSDGLVERCSTHLGRVIRDDYPLNHLDQVNMSYGLVFFWISPTAVFRAHANRLKNLDL